LVGRHGAMKPSGKARERENRGPEGHLGEQAGSSQCVQAKPNAGAPRRLLCPGSARGIEA
jgi:hypothetical protein